MFKKLLTISVLTYFTLLPFTAKAQDPAQPPQDNQVNENDQLEDNFSQALDDLFPTETELFGEEQGNFAQGDLEQDIVPRLLRLLVIISGTFITLIFTYMGFRLVLARDDDAELTNLKNTFTQVVIGTVLILSAFALVVGIVQYFDSLR